MAKMQRDANSTDSSCTTNCPAPNSRLGRGGDCGGTCTVGAFIVGPPVCAGSRRAGIGGAITRGPCDGGATLFCCCPVAGVTFWGTVAGAGASPAGSRTGVGK